jgi:hypothetical protein
MRQTITSFSLIQHAGVASTSQPNAVATGPGAEAAPGQIQPQRHIIYIFDDLNVSFADMAAVRQAAVSGRASLAFTGNHAKLEEAVTKLRFRQGIGPHAVSPCPDVSYYLADLIMNKTKTVNLKLSDATLAQVSAGIDVPSDFAVKPGIYLARVVVRETKGGAMSAQNGAVPLP